MARKARTSAKDGKKAGIIAFGVTLLVYALLFKFNKPLHYLTGGALSLAVGWVIKTMATPLKGLDKKAKVKDELNVTIIEDEYARGVVETGVEMLDALKAERNAINESVFTRRLDALRTNFDKLLRRVIEDNSRASRLRKLNTYYFPTAIKLMQGYRSAKAEGADYSVMAQTRSDILELLDKLIEATDKLLNTMLKADLDDMDVEMDVFDQMLRSDGLTRDELTEALRRSAHAAAKEIPMSAAPGVRPAAKPAPADAPVPMTATAVQMQQGAPVLRVPTSPAAPSFDTAAKKQQGES